MEIPNSIKQSLTSEQIELNSTISEEIKNKISELPTSPGVYLHKNSTGVIIYVGKAKNLRNRVRSYFQEGRIVDAKTKALVQHISDFEYIIVNTEEEAFILEDNLIKKYRPKYNIMLKDDKTYPYIKVTNEDYPRIYSTRKVVKDGAKYFGPYPDVFTMKMIVRLVRNLFYVRSCNLKLTKQNVTKNKFKVCLDYHIHKCEAPCINYISYQAYQDNIKKAIQILQGKTKQLENLLETQMTTLAEQEKFEQAAKMRDKLMRLKDFNTKQKIVAKDFKDRDIFGFARIEDYVCSVVFLVREGKVMGKKHFFAKSSMVSTDDEITQKTIENWYLEADFLPNEIILPTEPEDLEYITDWLNKKYHQNISIQIPKSGEKHNLVEMVNENAQHILKDHLASLDARDKVIPKPIQSLQRDLRLNRSPMKMECFDNSHLQGTDLVSSMVVFEAGKPKKSEYRKFKNEDVLRNDDFATMKEVVYRRYSRLLNEKKALPDLIIIDGGKGQLSAAVEVLEELGIQKKVNIIGLAKRLEEVFFPGESEAILLPKSSLSLRLLQQIRDEAHRFAITYHRKLRDKRTFQTELTQIEGIGKKKAEKLIQRFGSVKSIKEKTKEELMQVISEKDAQKIIDFFQQK